VADAQLARMAGDGEAAAGRPRARLFERSALRERTDVFADRADAGRQLAELVRQAVSPKARVLAIPAGGVPVAAALARSLGWPLDVAVVSKITLPWNTEAGYGAVAFDGSLLLNEELVRHCGLTERQVEQGVAATRFKVERRVERLRKGRGALRLTGETVVLVDDGLASGFTMRAAVAACRGAGALRVVVAVPTGHARAVERLQGEVDDLVCANVRSGPSFAVADAYERWSDVPEVEAELLLERSR
jgi:predicted phosphoribosyltransferase